MMPVADILAVVQAYREGKKIEVRSNEGGDWRYDSKDIG